MAAAGALLGSDHALASLALAADGAGDPDALFERVPPIRDTDTLAQAVDLFRRHPSARFLAVVSPDGRPVGAVGERLVRDLLFSPFGHALLANPGCTWTLGELVHSCPVAPIDAPMPEWLAIYAEAGDCEGMILTQDGRYAALLPGQALLQLAARWERQRAERIAGSVEGFRGEAVAFAALLLQSCQAIQDNAARVAERATLNRGQAAAVAAASTQSAMGIADVAGSAAQLADQVKAIKRRVGEAEGAMTRAVDEAASGIGRLDGLRAAAGEIGVVVALIGDIATKVKLLSVNATIEAARAGPHGRGFSVVAREVKALAMQASAAAEEIEEKIGSMRAAVDETAAVQGNIGAIVGQLGDVAANISESVAQQALATGLIAGNVDQAAQASADISSHIADMSARAAAAGDMAERMNGVAADLIKRASQLNDRIEAFLADVARG